MVRHHEVVPSYGFTARSCHVAEGKTTSPARLLPGLWRWRAGACWPRRLAGGQVRVPHPKGELGPGQVVDPEEILVFPALRSGLPVVQALACCPRDALFCGRDGHRFLFSCSFPAAQLLLTS